MTDQVRWFVLFAALLAVVWCLPPAPLDAQSPHDSELDELLDLYVRDGFVYYATLRGERRRLDRYVESLASRPTGINGWAHERRLAYLLNAYNALVLQTVIDHYPIRGRSLDYPENSIMQVPGAFSAREHRVDGRRLTLRAIEDEIGSMGDPRAYLALGRGAVGSPRLRSEAFNEYQLDTQLEAVVTDFSTTPRHVHVDRLNDEVVVSAVLGWRADHFATALGGTGRTAIERAVVMLIAPSLFSIERSFLAQNTFRLSYRDFDWRLNDLTGGAPLPRSVGGPWPRAPRDPVAD